jgi:Protein of unknown function (DUF2924)
MISRMRKLERLNLDSEASDAQKPARPISLKAGTRLVREWRGVTHIVLVHADGFEWSGRRIGAEPNTDWLGQCDVALDEKGCGQPLNYTIRCLLADVAGEGEHEGFRKEMPPGSFHIGAHAVGAHLQPGKQGREQGMGLPAAMVSSGTACHSTFHDLPSRSWS